MTEDEYAIVSKKEFMQLKKELDRLKKNPLEGSESGENLQDSIDNLNKSLNVMLEVFKQASEDMKLEEHETEMVSKQLGPINEKLETLIDQNQKIAKGIVAVADMVKEKLEEIEQAEEHPKLPPLGPAPKPKPSRPSAPEPARFGPAPGAPFGPPPGMPPMGPPQGMEEPEGLPPLTPPGAPPPGAPSGNPPPAPGERRDIMGGLMR
ncbi:hypothetical protein KY362_00290 [Candidatus Woesearchaeota archaeon]|nr:hypothetical protein [Candidatus Woesearchaeota archaeon]